MSYTRDELRWNGWGLARQSFDLGGNDEKVWDFLRESVGLPLLPETPARPLEACELPDVRLDAATLASLRDLCHASTEPLQRAAHALGRSYPDLLRLRYGDLSSAPDVVAFPASHEECVALVQYCDSASLAVVPFGGGSSVVGGVEGRGGPGHRGVVTLDTTRMSRMLELDEVSHTATFEAGVWGPDLEQALEARGYTLGHYPQSFEFSTLGGWIAARGAGQQSNRYGAANKWLVAARLATPAGTWETRPFPQSAAGPNLNEVVVGSEGTLGVITEATVKICALPEARDYRAYLFKSFEAGAAAIRRIVQAEIPVAMLRLSDGDESYFFGALQGLRKPHGKGTEVAEKGLAALGYGPGRCVLMVGLEGDKAHVRGALAETLLACTREGGLPVGTSPGRAWLANRFAMPYLRDPMMDRGIGVDTLETSTTWANLPRLYEAVRHAISSKLVRGAVLTHISHSYKDGASLYFTFFFPRAEGGLDAELAQWRGLKTAASDAIADHGGTISHHHGVGQDHAPWLGREKGELALGMLAAAKKTLDPQGVLNPGKLLVD
ncbi:MAG: FAD-binding oxidoreductase [Myxococcales bacterium]|nr:FAD-binding oxidoreductase [Myxococcales bacterium]